jgi:hypothetical protein
VIRSGTRRLVALVAALAAAAAAAALLGIATGAGVARSVALGCYVVGSLTGFIGFAVGSRGLHRLRRATAPDTVPVEDLQESRVVAALLMLVGVVFVLLGVAVDPRAHLV